MSTDIQVLGLNHNTAPVHVRERISFPGNKDGWATRILAQLDGIEEVMVLSTCNRAEIIAVTADTRSDIVEILIQAVGDIHKIDAEPLRDFFYDKKGIEAVQHVFRVASSLDSMVLGESQILGQVKDGYKAAAKANATGPILNRLMHRAFFAAKRVRSETGIGEAAVSVAYVAVELARKILGDLKEKSVLLIGAGEMAELAAKHLTTHVDQPVAVVNRTYENACALAIQLQGIARPMEMLEDALVDADVVITSTGSCEPLIRAFHMKKVMKRRRYRPIFLIDIAIPRDVEQAVNDLDGVYLYNIDDLQSVVRENIGERLQQARKAEKIIDQEVSKFMNWTRTLEATPTIIALKEKLENIRTGELARLNGKLSKLDQSDREIVELVTKSIINKIAHDPISFLKKAGARSRQNLYLDAVQRLFRLDGLSSDPNAGSENFLEDETESRNQG